MHQKERGMAEKPFRDKYGVIPDDHFENEPSKFKGLDKFMSREEIENFEAWGARQRAAADALLAKRGK
jgi:hypothetical protein